jgi:endosialidase-like protein
MIKSTYAFVTLATLVLLIPIAGIAQSERDTIPLKSWAAPLYWQPNQDGQPEALNDENVNATLPAGALVFVAITPCRVVDTRPGSGFTGAFGPPSLAGGTTRTVPIQSSSTCSIPATAQAYSFNVTVVPFGFLDYITVWPTGQPRPNASTLNGYVQTVIANAAIVPAGTSGSVDVFASQDTHLIIDINGYYAPQSGITLTQGSAGVPSLSFAGDPGTGIFSSAPGSLNIATGGVSRLSVASNGDVSSTGNEVVGGNLTVNGTINGSGTNLVNLSAANITVGKISGSQIATPLGLSGSATLGNGILTAYNFADDGVGVLGRAFGSANSGRIIGVWGVSDNAGGNGVAGSSLNGIGVRGNSSNGIAVAGDAGAGTGVFGAAYNATGTTYGVQGESFSTGGVGVYGYSPNIGLWGKSGSSTGFAGYFEGKTYFQNEVGIGTASPGAKLEVDGPSSTVNIESTEIVQLARPAVSGVKNTNSAGLFVGAFETGILGRTRLDLNVSGLPTAGNVYGTIPDVTVMSLLGNGNVGIGTTTPGHTLEVNGSVAGVGAYVILSDGRYKRDILPLSGALDKVLHMRGVSYEWRQAEYPQMNFSAGRQIGFVAQELEPVLPEAVSKDAAGVHSVAYTTVVPVLVEAIKEQQQQLADAKAVQDRQSDQLKQQQELIEEQHAEIGELKQLVCQEHRQTAFCQTVSRAQ